MRTVYRLDLRFEWTYRLFMNSIQDSYSYFRLAYINVCFTCVASPSKLTLTMKGPSAINTAVVDTVKTHFNMIKQQPITG